MNLKPLNLPRVSPRFKAAADTSHGSFRQRRGGTVEAGLIILAATGGLLLAFRWSTPVGNISVSRVAVVALAARLATQQTDLRRVKPKVLAAMLYLCALLLSSIETTRFDLALVNFLNGIEALLLWIGTSLAALYLVNVKGWPHDSVLRLPLYGYLPTGLLGLYQAAQLSIGQRPTIPLLNLANPSEGALSASRTAFTWAIEATGIERIAGATGDPATFGIASGLVAVYCVWILSRRSHQGRPFVVLCSVLGVAGVLLSASASAVIILFLGALSLLVSNRKRLSSQALATAVVLLLLCLPLIRVIDRVPVVGPYTDASTERMLGVGRGDDLSGQGHLALATGALSAFAEHPVRGVGLGAYSSLASGTESNYSSVHSAALLALAEGGIILFAALLFVWITAGARVPFSMFFPVAASWIVYLDFNRLPFLWVMVGVMSVCCGMASRHSTSE